MRESEPFDARLSGATFEILASLAQGDAPVATVSERLRELRGGADLPLATLYRLLQRAEEHGLAESVEAAIHGPGRPHRVFSITDTGQRALAREARRLAALSATVLESNRGR